MLTKFLIPASLALLGTAPAADAHHSRAMFDNQRAVTLTGTVRLFQWTNPHCYIQLVVKNDKGQDEEWSLEMGAPLHLYGKGWRPGTVKPGDRITVVIHPLRSGAKGGELQEGKSADGKPLGKPA